MKRRARVLTAALVVTVTLVIVALLLAPPSEEADGEDAGLDPPTLEDEWEDESGFLPFDDLDAPFDDVPAMRRGMGGSGDSWGGAGRGRGMGMGGPRRRTDGGVEDPEWAQRRARRRARFMRRIEIVSLGPNEPTTTNEEVFEAFRDVRPLVRDCLRDAGGERGSWRAMRETDRTLSFDIDAEGGVVTESIGFEPPLPEPLGGCMLAGLDAITVEPPGSDGARVSIDFVARRRRGRGDAGAR